MSVSLLTQLRANVFHHSSAVESILKKPANQATGRYTRTFISASNYADSLSSRIASLKEKQLTISDRQKYEMQANFNNVINKREATVVFDAREKLQEHVRITNKISTLQKKLDKFNKALER